MLQSHGMPEYDPALSDDAQASKASGTSTEFGRPSIPFVGKYKFFKPL